MEPGARNWAEFLGLAHLFLQKSYRAGVIIMAILQARKPKHKATR